MDRQLQHTSKRRQERELLLKQKRQAILIAKTTGSLIKVRADSDIWSKWSVGVNTVINNSASHILEMAKKSDKIDFIFLMIIPSPAWPFYFIYKGKIRGSLKIPKKIIESMKKTEDIRRKILTDYTWIKKVIESSETQGHLDSCRKIIENWSVCTLMDVRECKCAFYRTKDFKKTVEAYRRSLNDLIKEVAVKRVNMLHLMD